MYPMNRSGNYLVYPFPKGKLENMTLLYILLKREKYDCAHPIPVHTAVLPRIRGTLVLDTAQTLPAPPPVAIPHRLHRPLNTNMHTHTIFIHTEK